MSRSSAPPTPTPVGPPGLPSAAPAFHHVLIAVQLRGDAAVVPRAAWGLVQALGAQLTLTHVVLRPTGSASDETDGSPADDAEQVVVQRLRSAAVAGLGPPGQTVPIRILHGDPGQRLCEYAAFAGCDLIVLGPRAPRSLATALRGSAAKYVLHHAHSAVLVLPG